jgi:hypothetical protein
VRKGQYTRAVDDWLRTMRTSYPDYDAYVKELHLKPDSAQGEKKQVATAIIQENLSKGGPYGGFGLRDASGIYGGLSLGDLLRPSVALPTRPEPDHGARVSLYSRGYGFLSSPGANRPPSFLYPSYLAPQSPPSPFPYPYVRPHP